MNFWKSMGCTKTTATILALYCKITCTVLAFREGAGKIIYIMAKICLVVLIGLPAAGKTSFCKKLNQKLIENKDFQYYNIIYDNIIDPKIYESTKNFQNHYKKVRNGAFASVEDTIKSVISSPIDIKHVFIIDDNMYYRSMRYEYYKLARKYEISFLQIYIDIPLDIAIARNSKREEKLQVPDSIILDMAKKLESPGKQHWELNSLTLDSNSTLNESTLREVCDKLEMCIAVAVLPPLENTTPSSPPTKLQNIDLMLRKIVHKKIKEDNNQTGIYVRKKRDIFQKVKDSKLVISAEWNEEQIFNYLETLF